jgi:small-conductance mechanosensitive channel
LVGSIVTAMHGSNAKDASSLRSQIDAMAVALPGASSAPPPGGSTPTAQHSSNTAAPTPTVATPTAASRFGIWDEAAAVVKLSGKISSINAIDHRTEALQTALSDIQGKIIAQLRALSARGDALMAQADNDNGAASLGVTHDQLDALAGQFKQASVLFVPLRKQAALLDQYRRNLKNWHEAVEDQSRSALKSLGIRAGLLALILGAVSVLGELWHRGVLKYVQDSRKRYQLLLLRKIALWSLVVIIIGFTFASELGSIVTFAGLITAGLAVAMQSVLVSIVGYFFLIGKYGLRVGDRVQIGEVSGEIIELGMVRMHLMELAGRGSFVPTGRVAAFPNSVVFQVTSGLFKQIPGVSFAWHDITLALPPAEDYESIKQKLIAAANEALAEYREEIQRQTRELERTTLSGAASDALPTVQLSYSAKGVDAHVRYPVQLAHAAEVDERMSRALLQVISALTPKGSDRPSSAT